MIRGSTSQGEVVPGGVQQSEPDLVLFNIFITSLKEEGKPYKNDSADGYSPQRICGPQEEQKEDCEIRQLGRVVGKTGKHGNGDSQGNAFSVVGESMAGRRYLKVAWKGCLNRQALRSACWETCVVLGVCTAR